MQILKYLFFIQDILRFHYTFYVVINFTLFYILFLFFLFSQNSIEF